MMAPVFAIKTGDGHTCNDIFHGKYADFFFLFFLFFFLPSLTLNIFRFIFRFRIDIFDINNFSPLVSGVV